MLALLMASSVSLSLGHAANPDSAKIDLQWREKYYLVGLQAVINDSDEAYAYAGPKYDVNFGLISITPYGGVGVYYEEHVRNYWRTKNHFTIRYIFGIEATTTLNNVSFGAGINTITTLNDNRLKHALDNYGAGATLYFTIKMDNF